VATGYTTYRKNNTFLKAVSDPTTGLPTGRGGSIVGGQIGPGVTQAAQSAAKGSDPGTSGPAPFYDPMLDAYTASALRNQQLQGAWGTYQSGELDREYGFDNTGGIDPNNPYSRAALLQRSYQDAQRGNTNSYAAAGQLYSGALGRAQSRSYQDYDIGLDRLKTQYGRGKNQIAYDTAGSYAQLGSNIDSETFRSILAALARG
jgi:hypothetical protein